MAKGKAAKPANRNGGVVAYRRKAMAMKKSGESVYQWP
jgi:hypothetical protein